MSFILIDRRKAGRGKSSPNRQKLIRRIKSFIKSSSPQNIGTGGVVGGRAPTSSPVKVTSSALEEPFFAYSNDGEYTAVIIGNKEYEREDEIEFPSSQGGGGAGPGDGGEDEFIVNVARDEFLDLFFEDCELPNLTNEKYTEKLDNKFAQAGFSTTGSPAQLSIIRTYKQALGRRRAMSAPYKEEELQLLEEREKLVETIDKLKSKNGSVRLIAQHEVRIAEIDARLEELVKKFLFLRGFDTTDMRFRKKEAKPLKTVDAVLIMLMDISGSMDEERKTIARRWFALLYAFIKRRYTNTELVFIAHTDEPFEMSEDDFFSTRINGGTSVSPALTMINKIILERYDPNQTNIYVCHASDGDNWDNDGPAVVDEMVGGGKLMQKIQMFSYVEVGKPRPSWFGSAASGGDTNLWTTYEQVRNAAMKNKVVMALLEQADDCYPVFKKVFKKGKS